MANFNKIMLLGNLTRDPQLSYLPSNTPVVEFGLAVNRRYRRKNGEQGEETLFVDCRAYARSAEVLNQYCKKGNQLFIEGRLQLDRWNDKEGNPRSKHRVFIENFQFLGSRGESGESRDNLSSGAGHSGSAESYGGKGQSDASSEPPVGHDPIESDDIPF